MKRVASCRSERSGGLVERARRGNRGRWLRGAIDVSAPSQRSTGPLLRSGRRRIALKAILLASTALMGVAPAVAQTLPTGGAVAAGRVSIGTPSPGQMTINQSTSSAIVNWQSFSVGAGSSVTIVQPSASSALLNRVNGNTPSTIAGSINANGQVYLVNPNGITITGSGSVNAAGFVASTLGISDDDFTSGRRSFAGKGASAAVVNQGTITIGRGGYAALIGGSVDNAGTISVPLGRVGLGSGEQATLDLSGDGFLQVAVPTKADGKGALVSHSGRISADGGRVEIRAAAAREAVRQAVNLSGVVEARTVSGRTGEIVLGGSDGQVSISGRLDVSATNPVDAPPPPVKVAPTRTAAATPASRAGAVTVTARAIDLQAATIDASGLQGGGTVKIGGDVQGTGTLQRAEVTRVDAATTISADTIGMGDGGRVIIWSDADTRFEGNISARGGAAGGNGGFAEVSGKAHLTYAGITDLSAARGQFGTLLLDPYNVTISNGANSNQSGFVATGNDSVINVTTLQTALRLASVIVTTGGQGSQAGNITVADAISWASGSTLTLQAAGAITLNAGVTAASGGLALSAGSTIATGPGGTIDVGAFTLLSGNWTQVSATLPSFNATDFRLAGGTFVRALGGDGSAGAPYAITDVYGLQGMDGYRSGSFVLANDIDATGTARWNWDGTRYQGFMPIGDIASPFRGRFDGSGNTIANLTINRPSQDYVGLFGAASSAVITDVGLVGGSITGGTRTGALVGTARDGASISRVYATGTVSGIDYTGGLLGALSVNSTLTQAHFTGAVSGSVIVGGLAGLFSAGSVISQAYVTGTVSGITRVGGLVGNILDGASITRAYASGRVSATVRSGGVAGYYDSGEPRPGTASAVYWDTQTTGQANAVGELIGVAPPAIGLTTAQARTTSSYVGFDFANTWFQTADLRPIGRWEAARAVNGVIPVSTLNQLQLMTANLGASYALDRDIDARASSGSNAAGIYSSSGFVPVGSVVTAFSGALNGMDHVIDGLTINRPSTSGVGLFGVVGYGGANVSNIGLTNVTVVGASAVGGVAGVNNGVLNRTYVTGTVTGTNSVGGLVGVNTAVVVYSYTDAAVRGSQETGGLIGSNNGAVQYTYAIGSVNGSGASTGGLVGRNATGSGVVDHSYASGAVTGTVATGGLVGTNEATVINSFWDIGSTGQSTSAGGTGLTTAQARQSSSHAGWNFQSVWFQADGLRPIGRWEMAAPVNGVTTISNLHQLQLIGGQLSGSYVLDRNIDATPTSGANPSGIWDASGFNPLGSPVDVGFSGTFDGQGHVISGLTINRPTTSYVGLFGYTSDATIRRVGLVGGKVTGQDSVGALVGRAYGSTISDTFASTAVNGNTRVGGLLGENNGTWGGGDVTRSFATGAVTGAGQTVGGFVGWNSNATISQAYATGAVTATGGTVIGGFAGWNAGTIRQAYATGAAAGGTTVGGFVGLNGGALDQVYSMGAVTGTGGLGGLVGARQPSGTATAAYWNTETSGRSTSQGGTGRTTAAMQTQAGFAGFDWSVWSPPDTTYRPELFGVSGVVGVSTSLTRTYGDSNPLTPAYYGAGYWNTITAGGSLSTSATTASGVGFYNMTASGVAGAFTAGGASRIVYLGGSLLVAPRAITVTAQGQSRAYGDANAALTYSITSGSLVNGDSLTGALATTATTASSVGLYGITQGTLAASSNYTLTYVDANIDVTRRAITVTADGKSRQYGDGNPALSYNITSGSLVNGDTLSGSLATSATVTSGVGDYAITRGALAASSNYDVTYVGANLRITPRPITVTADTQSRAYGDANPALTHRVTSGSLVNGDLLAGALTTDADGVSGVGTYAITRGSLAASMNYALTFVGADLTVTSRSITVTADAQSRVYGDANPALTYRITSGSLVNGDSLNGQLATSAGTTSGVGRYGIERGSLSANPNYALIYVGADLTVTQRPITIAADAQSRVYGDANPALTHRITDGSLVNGDALSGDLATTANGTSGIGTYAITQGTLAVSPDYAITYVGADLTVIPRPITVTGDTLSRAYGDANPPLTYAVTSGSLINGDSLTGALATTATSTSNVGDYVITQGTLAASPNYALTYSKATLSVTPRPITVTADALSRVYGDANPALTYQITAGSLVNGDGLSGALTTNADGISSVGAYAIGQGSLAASSNYALTYVGADLTVASRAITVTADAQSRVYGDANPALTYRITSGSLVNGDTLEGRLATGATETSDVGRYSIERGSLSPNPNYALTYVGADLTVTPRPITVTADALSRIYGNGNPALTWAITSGNLMEGDGFTGGLTTAATVTSGVGRHAITQGTLAASANYAVTYVGADLTITPRPITVQADAQSRVYGDANPALTYAVTSEGGLVNGDTLSGALDTTATATSDIGIYAITQGSLGSPNYALTFTGADLTITPRSITVTAQAASRVYGDANPALTFTTSDRGVGAAVAGTLSSLASATSGIGIYAIGQGTVSDINNPNYRITYVGADFTITPRPITVTADSQTVTAGQVLPRLTYGIGGRGLVNGDTLSGDLATDATTASAPGAYAIGQGTLAASANYQMTFVPGTLTLAPAAVGTPDSASMIDRTIRAHNVQWRPFSSALSDVAAAQSAVGNGVLVEDPRFSGRFFCLGAPALSSCGSAPR